MSSPVNLGLVGAGFATIGGMVYGGYELLKNEDRPMSILLDIRKRIPLDKNNKEDDGIWLQNWQHYIKAHIKIETEEVKVDETPPSDPPKTKTVKKEVINKDDVWGFLSGWTDPNDSRKDKVPDGFKNKCVTESKKEHAGIWAFEYKNFESYCTKPKPFDD